jgi:hypothetical protein
MAEQANQPALVFGSLALFNSLAHADKLSVLNKAEARARAIMDMGSYEHVLPLEIDVWLPVVAAWMEEKAGPCGPEIAEQAFSLAMQVLNCKPLPARVRQAYTAIMAEFPADLLLTSVRGALGRERYHVMPTPGALVDIAQVDLADRRRRLQQVRLAMRRLEMARSHRERLSRYYSRDYQSQLEQERSTRALKC